MMDETCDYPPLHINEDEGHLDTLRELLCVDVDTGLNGMTSLHVAAIKGQTLVLRELVRVRPELLWVPTKQGETVLHLAVEWNHVEALKFLVEETMNDERKLVNWKDWKGNTVLHVAVSNKHLQIVKYLLSLNALQVNALNKNELTALDLLTQSPPDLQDMEIECALRNVGASSIKDLHLITHDWLLGQQSGAKEQVVAANKRMYWLCIKLIALVLVASLTGAVAFEAGKSLVGSWHKDFPIGKNGIPDNNQYDDVATDNLLGFHEGPVGFGLVHIFMYCTIMHGGISFFILLAGWCPLKRLWWMCLQIVMALVGISFQVGIYLLTLQYIVVPK